MPRYFVITVGVLSTNYKADVKLLITQTIILAILLTSLQKHCFIIINIASILPSDVEIPKAPQPRILTSDYINIIN